MQAAKRELKEETGLKPKKIVHWKKTGFSGKICWDTYYFVAKECKKISSPKHDKGEKIVVIEKKI